MLRDVQVVLAGLLAVVFGLGFLARRFPDVAWLQVFRFNLPQPSEEQRARWRRRANIHAGIELILLGMVLPLLYVGSTVMFFNAFTATGIALVAAGSLLCIALGVIGIWRNRRRDPGE